MRKGRKGGVLWKTKQGSQSGYFRSDTVTLPTAAMYEAMAQAPVGDDVYQDDPSVNLLEARAAELTGKEAALFVPSGTIGNQIAISCHTKRGDGMIVGANSHIFLHEVGGAALLSGVSSRPVYGEHGVTQKILLLICGVGYL